MAARVWLEPGYKCLSDEPVRVRVGGLSPLQPVTMRAGLSDEKGETFGSAAFYRADERGELDLNRSPSLGGHYTGTEPMGLFWSLTPVKPFSRLVKRDVAGSPLRVHIEVFDGHDGDAQERPLASCVNERWFMKEGVTRIPVREGRVRGVLFVPPGKTSHEVDSKTIIHIISNQMYCISFIKYSFCFNASKSFIDCFFIPASPKPLLAFGACNHLFRLAE
ncbi:acyl-coenzyme A thioesterase 3-like [Amblyraja radiata]|uniref:acyl-coenzyme A thioesterase 3-like n=1 Tax=Amblyraja radiata TaxID=386614 RepID=UPI00140333E3|nr:acyl-coenzyme A thioesterase 3-like [Amblyraja radiata]